MSSEALTTLFTNIANAIRSKSGTSAKMLPREMGNVIRSIKNVPQTSQQGTLNGIFQDMADAIRACGVAGTMTPLQMPDKILLIPAQQSSLVIQAEDVFTGKTTYCKAYYNDQLVAGQWSLTSGSQYATINQNGRVGIQSGTQNQTIVVSCQYDGHTATKSILVSYDNQLTIECAETLSGTQAQLIARYNGSVVQGQWSISSGQQYASINDSSGLMTITASGSVVVQVAYGGYTTQKTVQVQYVANQSSQTVVNDDGSVTTETTTTTTNQDGSTTTETTSTTTNEDGSYSQNASTTTQNQDGSSTTTSNTTNSDGTSSQTTSSTSAPDSSGSTTTTSATTNYDESGNVSGSQQSQKTDNTDGSYQSSVTNYNADGDPTDKTNQDGDSSGNISTQDVTFDENGQEEVVGYTIDTSGSDTGAKEITSGVDTGMLVFDGHDWDAILKVKFRYADLKDTANNPVINMTYRNPDNNNKVEGIVIIIVGNTYGGTAYNENNQKLDSDRSNTLVKMRINNWANGSQSSDSSYFVSGYNNTNFSSNYYFATRSTEFTLTYKVSCRSSVISAEIYDSTGQNLLSKPRYKRTFNISNKADGITFELGHYTMNDGTELDTTMQVLDFNVKKL